jgi:glycosyltransferase involved in cell wall biosynthesis
VNDAFFSPPARVSGRTLFTIGHSTDYTVFKGTQDFLAILARLKELRVPFRAVISESIADPITKRAYEDFIKTHNLSRDVTFVGTLSETGLVSFYRHLDVFVFTGSPEGSGAALASLSVLEAAACGVPVVRSIGDDGEVREGVTGYYINPHKALKAAKTIAKLLHMAPNERQRMRRAARAHVVRAYGWDASATLLQKEIARLSSLTKKRRFQE